MSFKQLELDFSDSEITSLHEGKYISARLVDETAEVRIDDNIYSRSETSDLLEELKSVVDDLERSSKYEIVHHESTFTVENAYTHKLMVDEDGETIIFKAPGLDFSHIAEYAELEHLTPLTTVEAQQRYRDDQETLDSLALDKLENFPDAGETGM